MPIIVNFEESPGESVSNYCLIDLVTGREWQEIYRSKNCLGRVAEKTTIGELNVIQLSQLAFIIFSSNERAKDSYQPCHALNRLIDRACKKEGIQI